jgi:Gas vesicle synthesis protein GvpL/GvpF
MNDQAEKILIYAVSRANCVAEIQNLPNGIETQISGNLAVFFSRINQIVQDIETLKKYHDVISELHSAITIIPFRYGSYVETLQNLQTWIENEQDYYLKLSAKLDGLTEMSLRIFVPPIEQEESAKPTSGKDYLLKKSKAYRQNEKGTAIIELLKTELQKYIRDLKHEKRDDILSVYFLVKKSDVEDFRRSFSETEKQIDFKCVLTGGWCPFNFCTNDV